MADWYGAARSNYVRIKDMEGLKASLEPFEIEISHGSDENEGKICLLGSSADNGGMPSYIWEDGTDEMIEFSFAEHVCPFMEDGEILVVMESGAEKLRYITGYASAYNAKGDAVHVSLSDIYTKAAEFFNIKEDDISRCEN